MTTNIAPTAPDIAETLRSSAPEATEEHGHFGTGGKGGWGQLDPTGDHGFAYYRLLDLDDNLLAEVVANDDYSGMTPRMEYWKIADGRTELDTAGFTGIRVTRDGTRSTLPFTPSQTSFTCSTDPPWSTRSTEGSFHVVSKDGAILYGLRLRVSLLSGSWSGYIQWFSNTDARMFALDTSTTRTDVSVSAAGTYTSIGGTLEGSP